MNLYAADLHVHIGRSAQGRPVKITAARDLTFENIAAECLRRKGLDLVGIVDCASPPVLCDIEDLLAAGDLVPLPEGGLRYRGELTVLLGAEFESREPSGGLSHHVGYFPTLDTLREFSTRIGERVTNRELSSQASGLSARDLSRLILDCGGLPVPAHCFTPHKSLYGACAERAAPLYGPEWDAIPALELGLSADTFLADRLAELAPKTFLSNSDAHSLPKIAREYNLLELAAPTFSEFLLALRREGGRRVAANFGLDPRLGKYHRTSCEACGHIAQSEPPCLQCEACGSVRLLCGVLDRLTLLADRPLPPPPPHRPPYRYQVPLEFVPGVGPVVLQKLLNRFGTEMAVLHQASPEDLTLTVGSRLAQLILLAREGRLALQAGGGGAYGKALPEAGGQMGFPGL